MPDNQVVTRLLSVLDALSDIARAMHPRRLPDLIEKLGDRDTALRQAMDQAPDQIVPACAPALQACTDLRAAPAAENPRLETHRALRHYSRTLEALAPMAETDPQVSRYLLEPQSRDDPALRQRLSEPPHPDSGIFHANNRTNERGGFSVYVPPWYDPASPTPLIMALHGGAGHGRLFLWNWLPEARSRGMIIVAPTAIGQTWSLMEPEIDSQNLQQILIQIRARWNIDPKHLLLSGMSDGGTFTLLAGLADGSPFTHLAPVASAFHPMLVAMTDPQRLRGLPIHLTHGAQDWMFPVQGAREVHQALAAAGADIHYREIADLAHAYPRDGQGEVLNWFTTQ